MVGGTEHNPCGIQSFRCRDTKDLFETGHSRRFMGIAQQAILKLDQLDAATKLSQLARPPGNQLKALTGDRLGQFSIRINRQWRLCFNWDEDGPSHVEIIYYH